VVPILQVLLLRFVDPPFTLTMFEEARLATKASARFKWVVHENRSLEQLGENVARAAGYAAGFRGAWQLAKSLSTLAGAPTGHTEHSATTDALGLEHLNP
jgi:hypothetical protein